MSKQLSAVSGEQQKLDRYRDLHKSVSDRIANDTWDKGDVSLKRRLVRDVLTERISAGALIEKTSGSKTLPVHDIVVENDAVKFPLAELGRNSVSVQQSKSPSGLSRGELAAQMLGVNTLHSPSKKDSEYQCE